MNKNHVRVTGLIFITAGICSGLFAYGYSYSDFARINPENSRGKVAWALLLIFLVYGILLLWSTLNVHKKKNKYLLENGIAIDARVVETKRDIPLILATPYRGGLYEVAREFMAPLTWSVITEGTDPVTKTLRTFKSERVWLNSEPIVPPNTFLKIYIDPQNPREYYVDTSFLKQKEG